MAGSVLSDRLGEGLGDTNGLSWTSGYCQVVARQPLVIDNREKELLRGLALQVADIANHPCQDQQRNLWRRHNDLQETRPLIFCDPENAWYEIFPAASLKCKNALARIWEFKLLKEIYWANIIKDDRVCEPYFSVHYIYNLTKRGVAVDFIESHIADGAHTWKAPLAEYFILSEMKPEEICIDFEKTNALLQLAKDIFADILEVRLEGSFWWSFGLTSDAIYLRGFENFLYDMYDEPEGLHSLMAFLRDEAMGKLDYLEDNGLLTPNSLGDFIGTGGYGYTSSLPDTLQRVKLSQMWGFSESQETVSISTEFFEEFVFRYQLPILKRFGLNIYGCCEPLDNRLDVIKRIPRLRRVTVSPWANKDFMAEALGSNYVYCSKINPSHMAQKSLYEDAAQSELREVFLAAKRNSCPAEVMLRDVVTLGGNPQNASRWVELARRASKEIYGE